MKRLKSLVLPLALAGTVVAGVASEVVPTSPAGAGNASTGQRTAVARAAASTSLTAKATTAAKAFKASLSSSQRSALQYSFGSSKKKTGWSNLPTSLVARNGVRIEDLSSAQLAKLRTLLKLVMSSSGYADEEATREADQYLADNGGNSAGGPGGGLSYGHGLYYVAYFGTPSTSKKWTIQFGGHHYQFHLTFSGSKVSNTPYFAGVEPRAAFTESGKTYAPMADESTALFGAVQSLNSSQLAKAKLSQSFDDVLVGPQKDGQFPAKQGITISSLSASQRKIVTRAIRSYVADFNRKFAEKRVALYESQYSKTKLAYSGTTSGTTQGDYVRLHGPRLWIEIAVQNGIVFTNQTHFHSIERDIKSDYGAGT